MQRWSQSVLSAVIVWLVGGATAAAQQPLAQFLEAAQHGSLDLREARATLDQARSQTDEARARLLPSAMATAGYARNEIEVAPSFMAGGMTVQAVIQPYDQLDARFQLTVPILDLAAWTAFFQSEELGNAADARVDVAEQGVRIAVVQLYYQVVGARALVDASERNLAAAQESRDAMAARVEVGQAAPLELARAEAELARARQSLAAAQLGATLAAHNVEDLTGLTPSPTRVELTDELTPEAPLETFSRNVSSLPTVRAAQRDVQVAERGETAAWLALLPTVAGTATERVTNAAGFGPNSQWTLSITATWQLDFGRPAAIGTRGASRTAAEVRLERAQQQARTAIFEAWHRVQAAIASAEAARTAEQASRRASEDARARFESGVGTQLEQIQADRDLFSSEVQAIQATADLRVARAVLRLRSGQDL
ncbi:MAG: TolC family protein [Sandaracinaceae bacterium]